MINRVSAGVDEKRARQRRRLLAFVARKNVERYRALLEAVQNEETRRLLERLIAEEEARLTELAVGKTESAE